MKVFSFYSLILAVLFFSCQNNPKPNKSQETADSEWKDMVVSNSFEGWHLYQDDGSKGGWTVADNILTFNSEEAEGKGDKSLISDDTYTNFEIKFDWKVSEGANSGFIWGVNEDQQFKHPYETGPEIQILDPQVYLGDEKNQVHTAGALYDMIAPSSFETRPAGEWNNFHITINHSLNEGVVVLNGVEVNRFPLHGPEWDSMVASSKFADWQGFGKFPTGSICLQDHPGIIAFKNIKIKRLAE